MCKLFPKEEKVQHHLLWLLFHNGKYSTELAKNKLQLVIKYFGSCATEKLTQFLSITSTTRNVSGNSASGSFILEQNRQTVKRVWCTNSKQTHMEILAAPLKIIHRSSWSTSLFILSKKISKPSTCAISGITYINACNYPEGSSPHVPILQISTELTGSLLYKKE